MCAGTYTVTALDSSDMSTATADVIITEPAVTLISASQTNVSCNGLCDGSASITITGGASPYSCFWCNGQNTTTAIGLCGGNCGVTVTDSDGCTAVETVTITEPPVLTIIISSVTNVTCFGSCNGSAYASASGGVPPYSYVWSNSSTSSTLAGVCAGNYPITVTDANGCTVTSSVNISQPAPATVSVNTTNATCNQCDGSAWATASGGCSQFSYLWSNGAIGAGGTFCPGNYSVTVYDCNLCTASTSFTILSSFIVHTSSTPSACLLCDGSVNVDSITGGVPPYTYAWANGATTLSQTNLCQGNYGLTVTDDLGCTSSTYVTVPTSYSLTSTITSTPTVCGACTGTASVTYGGGNAPYSILWSNTATTPDLTNLCVGSYSCTVTDANGCTQVLSAIVSSNYSFTNTISFTQASCSNTYDGTATVNVSGGTPPFTYMWSNGATTPTITGLIPALYRVTVTETASGCTQVSSITVTSVSGYIYVNFNAVHTPCASCTGSLTANVSGGIQPYTYQWSPNIGAGQGTNVATDLCQGTYTLTVSDDNGCTKTASQNIIATTNLAITFTKTNTYCTACNGTIKANVTGGTQPFTFNWSATVGAGQGTDSVSQLCQGTYSVTVTDAVGCTKVGSTSITTIQNLSISASGTPSACTACTGTATVSILSGTSPYTYHWNTSDTTQSIDSLCPNTYTITVTDANGCVKTFSTLVTILNGVTIVTDSLIHVSCSNNGHGSIAVHGAGGTPPYTYNWVHGPTTPAIANLNPGYYTVHVTDSLGCAASQTFSIANTYNIYLSITAVNANCTNNGSATANVTGQHPPFTFYWSDPLHQTSQTASNLTTGYYHVTVTDAIGCTKVGYKFVDSDCKNVIIGRIYFDANQNCVQDSGEIGIPNIVVQSTGNYNSITNSMGDYIIRTPIMNNTVYPSNNFLNCYNATCPNPAILYVNFINQGDTSLNNDFGYYAIPSFFDLKITQASVSAIRPGFNTIYYIRPYNNSPTTQNATLRLTYNPNLIYINSNYSGVNNSSLNTVEWTATNIPPFSYFSPTTFHTADFYLPPSYPAGNNICALNEVLPIIGDGCPYDNTRNVCQIVTSSYDPNMKEVFPTGIGTEGLIIQSDSVLNYTVHFQNTGTDTAFTVVIVDTLSQYLDPLTFVAGASSHPYTVTMADQSVLTFQFDNILLPDSNIDETASNGFFNYSVNLKPNLAMGTVIENTAYIFFDFNQPVATNTTINTVVWPTMIPKPENKETVSVFPNPFSDYTTIKIAEGITHSIYTVKIFDLPGKCVLSYDNINSNVCVISSKYLRKGVYFFSVSNEDREIGRGKLIVE
jgi:uncharacterized repeat protein (TIGR01451 family)